MTRKRYAVVIVTYGEVENLTVKTLWPSSRMIVKVVTRQIVKLPKILIYFLADYRSARHYIDWRLNRYESSLVAINRAQKDAVALAIRESGSELTRLADVDVVEAYYFVPPYLEDILPDLQRRYDGVVVVPMIPVESAFSCGVACQMVTDVFGESMFWKTRVMARLWKDPELHRIYTDYLFDRLSGEVRDAGGARKGLVLVIHGTLVRDRKGNPPKMFTGLDETEAFFELMKQRILSDPRNIFTDIKQGCFNHRKGGEWSSDTLERALQEFREDGYESVVMFPYGFFADNSETELEAKKHLDHSGFPVIQYIPCINNFSDFTRWLAGKIIEEIEALQRLQGAFSEIEQGALNKGPQKQ